MRHKINDFLHEVQNEDINLNGVIVYRDGDVDARYLKPDEPRNIYSVSKSFLSTAIGILLDDGQLHLDDRPVDFFPEYLPENPADGYDQLTLYHLLTMSSGHGRPLLHEDERNTIQEKDWIRFVLSQPLVSKPGEVFKYSNGSAYLAGCMAEKATGMKLKDFLMDRMFSYMDIAEPEWDECPMGHTFGASRLHLKLSDMLKLGILYLNKGCYAGKRIVSEKWVDMATGYKIASCPVSAFGTGEDERYGYGFMFWLTRYPGIYRAYGRLGQFVIVVPEQNTVIATSSFEPNEQKILNAVWKTLL